MPHVLVIGAYGSAGVAAAEHLATADADVEITMVDDGEPGGGLCILRGCMPSKEVLSAAGHRYQARHDHRLPDDPPEVDLEAVVETKNDHVEDFAAHRRAAVHRLAEREDVAFHHETARFVDDRVVEVGDRTYEPDYVVIATGSTPNVPDLPGLEDVGYMTSADVLDATEFPETGIVMGFGYVGMELAPYLAEAGGMDLTVIEHDDRPLDEADPVFGDRLLEVYREEFDITVPTNTHERRVEPVDGGVRLHAERDGEPVTYEADQLFVFTGRRPNLDGLGLERTSLEPGPGWVEATMQARDDERVYVAGDANGREPILHVAKEQAHRAARNILAHDRGEPVTPYENVHHHVVFSGASVYPFARVGHNEATAREAGHEVLTATRDARDDGVFRTKAVPRGLAKLVVDAEDGTVLGYQGFHHHADSIAKTLQVIVEGEMDVRAVPDRAYHPTLPEILDGLFRSVKADL